MRFTQGLFKILIIIICLMLVLSFIRLSLNDNNPAYGALSFADVVEVFQSYDFDIGGFFKIFDSQYEARLQTLYGKIIIFSYGYGTASTTLGKILVALSALADAVLNIIDIYILWQLSIVKLALFFVQFLISIITLLGKLFGVLLL